MELACGKTWKWPSAATQWGNQPQAEAKTSHLSPLWQRRGSFSPLPCLKGRGLYGQAASNSLSASSSRGQSPPGELQPGLEGCPHRWRAGSSQLPSHCWALACCPHHLPDDCHPPLVVSWVCFQQCASRCLPETQGWKAWNYQGLVVRAAALPSSHPAAASLVMLCPGQVSSGRTATQAALINHCSKRRPD